MKQVIDSYEQSSSFSFDGQEGNFGGRDALGQYLV